MKNNIRIHRRATLDRESSRCLAGALTDYPRFHLPHRATTAFISSSLLLLQLNNAHRSSNPTRFPHGFAHLLSVALHARQRRGVNVMCCMWQVGIPLLPLHPLYLLPPLGGAVGTFEAVARPNRFQGPCAAVVQGKVRGTTSVRCINV
jgi:hypothetical protein